MFTWMGTWGDSSLCSSLSVALRLCQRKIIVVQNSPFVARGGSDVVVEVEGGGAEKGVRSWEGEVTLEAIAHSGSHKHTETHNPGHIRERIKLFYSSNKTGNSAKETLDSRLLMQTVQTATLVNKEWFFAFVKHHLTGCIVSNVGTHNLKHYYLLCIYRCVFSVFWATVHWLHDFLPSYRLLESFVLYLALMIMPWNVEYNPLPSDSGLWHQWVKAHLRLDIKFTVSVSSACHVTLKVE